RRLRRWLSPTSVLAATFSINCCFVILFEFTHFCNPKSTASGVGHARRHLRRKPGWVWVDFFLSVEEMPLAGHLGVAVVIRCPFGGAVELEDGVEADFPDSLRDRCRLGADSDLALVFVAAQFALDSNVRTLGESEWRRTQPACRRRRIDATRSGIP